ncbi:hypothetical protein ED562_08255 [Microcystis aeruginosa FACHB-524]|uniref:hypothetical protein n=1 Tax=Microcystis aeruginosa TaxID=1126 RepID=UPI000F45D6A9|nr:hypothetical protein [Microcystis aeruginosa]ROI07060.1 hypothetical protein ED562_08255 [Microcystis aeruginosa FACHB-524]
MESIEYENAKNYGRLQGQIDCLSKTLTSLESSVEQLKIESHFQKKRLKFFGESLKEFRLSIADLKDRIDWDFIGLNFLWGEVFDEVNDW